MLLRFYPFFRRGVSATSYLLSVIDGTRRGPVSSLVRGTLGSLAYVYAGSLKLFLLPYRIGIRRQARLPCPVISVGNLTVGGTGKTPMTRHVCEILLRHQIKPCVLIRGYRGASEHGAEVVSSPQRIELTQQEAGDEGHLLASLLPGVPVIAGKDRRVTGALGYDRFKPDVFVLDDGMQFYQLHRDLDVVLLDAQRPFDNGWTFPRGLLREPPSHLRRAGCIVITNGDKAAPESVESTRLTATKLSPGHPVLTAKLTARSLNALDRSHSLPSEWLKGRKAAVLSAIGNPESFARQVANLGALVVHRVDFTDHHEVTVGELNEVIEAACGAGAEAIIVTEKDAVKLPPLMRPIPFYALAVTMTVDDKAAFERILLKAAGK